MYPKYSIWLITETVCAIFIQRSYYSEVQKTDFKCFVCLFFVKEDGKMSSKYGKMKSNLKKNLVTIETLKRHLMGHYAIQNALR